MLPERRQIAKRTVPFLIISIVIFVLYLFFFVDIETIVFTLRGTNASVFIALVFLVFDSSFYALAWHFLLSPLGIRVSLDKILSFVWIGTYVDLLVPAESVSGEISRAYLMSKELNEDPAETGKIVASLVGQRILGMILTVSSLTIGLSSFILFGFNYPPFIPGLTVIVITCISIPLLLLVLLCLKPNLTWKIISALIRFVDFISRRRWNLDRLKGEAKRALESFYEAMRVFVKSPRKLFFPLFFSVASWISKLMISYVIFFSLGYPIPISVLLVVHSVVSAIQSIPLGVPAQIGLTEFTMIELYSSFQLFPVAVNRGICGAATVLVRILSVWLQFFIGFAVLQVVGVKTLMRTPQIDRGEDSQPSHSSLKLMGKGD